MDVTDNRHITLRVPPHIAYNEEALKQYIAQERGIDVRTINALRIRKRSIDARQRTIFVNLTVEAYVNEMPPQLDFEPVSYQDVSRAPRVVVVGAGPGGLFAALRLIELGKRPVVLERGKDVHERRKDIALISREHKVDAESNYSFGEGAFPFCHRRNVANLLESQQSLAGHAHGVGQIGGVGWLVIEIAIVAE